MFFFFATLFKTNKTCACSDDNVEHPGKKCGPTAKLGETCDLPICEPTYSLQCQGKVCQCKPENLPYQHQLRCGPPGLFNDVCSPDPPCTVNSNLTCDISNGTCACIGNTIPKADRKCALPPPANFGKPCNIIKEVLCKDMVRLNCSSSSVDGVCQCNNRWMEFDDLTGGCKPLPLSPYNGSCELVVDCLPNLNLECKGRNVSLNLSSSSVDVVCQCNNRWMEVDIKTGACKPRPLSPYKGPCELLVLIACQMLKEENCGCIRRWMELDVSTKGCKYKPISILRGPYCTPGFFLICNQSYCACDVNAEPDPIDRAKCRRNPSKYLESCHSTEECLMNDNLVCDPVHKICDCGNGFELDNGMTPCKTSPPFDAQTYRRTCDDTQIRKHCYSEHNLECLQGICVCKDGYKPDASTLRNKDIGVIVCVIGEGNQGHGASCNTMPKDVTQKCDTAKQLTCNNDNLVCVCKTGYIPEHNKSGLCQPGVSKYNETCDPPEIIIRLPPVDPETSVVPPGPRSPPPPKIACNPDLLLECLNSVCVCQDEGLSGRYRLDKKSGKCLIAPGFSCQNDAECESGKCIELGKSEDISFYGPHSHTHKTTVCSSLPGIVRIITSGVKVIDSFRNFIFSTIFIILYQ